MHYGLLSRGQHWSNEPQVTKLSIQRIELATEFLTVVDRATDAGVGGVNGCDSGSETIESPLTVSGVGRKHGVKRKGVSRVEV